MGDPNPEIWNKLFRANLNINMISWTAVSCPCCNYPHMQQSGDEGIIEWTCPNCNHYYEEPDINA